MVQGKIAVDYAIVLTLISIIIVGAFSALTSVRIDFHREKVLQDEFSTYYHYFEKLSGLYSHYRYIHFPFDGHRIHIQVNAENIFSVYLYDIEGTVMWSKVNVTTVYDSVRPVDFGYYVHYIIEIYNPNPIEIQIEVKIDVLL